MMISTSLVVAGMLLAADWPQWRGPDRTGHVPKDSHIIRTLPTEPKVVWKTKAGPGLASPVVSGDFVILFDAREGKETVHAARRGTGEIVWSKAIDETFHDTQGPDGPRCTPLVDETRVYAVSCRGELQCLNLKDGKLVWRTNFEDFGTKFIGEKGNAPGATRHGNNGTPLIQGDRLYVLVGSPEGAGVVCFDKRDGKVIWKSQNDPAAYAPPEMAKVAGVEQLLCFTSDGLISLNPKNGELYWRHPIKTAFGRHVTAPVAHEDTVVVSSHQAGLIGVKVTKGNGKPEIADTWTSKEAAINYASPVKVGGHLYGLGPRKNLQCVEIASGKQLWSQEGYFQSSADKAYGGFLVMGENILCLTDTGQLVLFAADPKEFKLIGTAQVSGANWCNPAYADGKLFLRDGNKGAGEWLCLDLKETK